MDEIPYKKYIAIVIPYAGLVSTLYLLGYWGSFNVNILEYVGLQDLIKLALFPFLGAFIMLLIVYGMQEIIQWKLISPGGGSNSALGRLFNKYWFILLYLNSIIIGLIIIFAKYPEK